MKWHEDQEIRSWLTSVGMVEAQSGRWTGPTRIIQDFDGGLTMTTVALVDDPRFDITTVHEVETNEHPMVFIIRCLQEHTEEIKRKTEILREKGMTAVEDKNLPN